MLKFASLAAASLALTSAVGSRAQDGSNKSAPVDETIVLSPFSVSSEKDYGYRASASITATGIGTEIRNVPANI